jgi:cyclopropane-fatty-acyl-phospholipid synthase
VHARPGARLLDVGCGWGAALACALHRDPDLDAVGLTLSPAQQAHCDEVLGGRAEVRLEDWQAHTPSHPYDAILSFGAFEHFARDGSRSVERVLAYRRFFAACHSWLVPGGRLGLETIAHDDAPDTAAPKGRGPLGDAVLDLFPESLCPHLAEIVLGFEPWFRVEVLRSDAADFARTFRAWSVRLRAAEEKAGVVVGAARARQFVRYLASSELQFRTGALTNYRLVLRRRDVPHEALGRTLDGAERDQ